MNARNLLSPILIAMLFPKLGSAFHLPRRSNAHAPFNPAKNLTTRHFSSTDGRPINTTGDFEIWYFDFISEDLTTAAHMAFNVTPTNPSIPSYPIDAILSSVVDIMLPNKTHFLKEFHPRRGAVSESRDISAGRFGDDTDYVSWRSDVSFNRGSMDIDMPGAELKGRIKWEQAAPPHLPWGLYEKGGTYELVPHLWWTNQGPDLTATVEFEVAIEHIRFSGIGYQDKIWADLPLPAILGPWYWGHVRIGGYSLVWYELVSKFGGKYYSSYLARDGEVLTANCANNTLRVQPFDKDGVYLPPDDFSLPAGFIVSAYVPGEGQFTVNVTNDVLFLVIPDPVTRRWIGHATGGFEDGDIFEGSGFWEQAII
ncbi:hypothetical protein P170DRAFT_478268 [Aspergillus steynii IBT 23096]|uniref:AttH domain-containing protein n=1 Tax=Aspergillus steynii IBT 23096 TaxID=1392250 RepID=A0A2I2G3G9_9EURO|nr:uncharacterized protein P170DRAFT_478268 [Aspergillus steynii IBT 23096]PLB47420.1 hypothetical protein P170DRAFT_478268 [Aspergillus steynii IBT 23096]